MVQSALDNGGVLALIRERQFAAIARSAARVSRVFREKPGREIHSLDIPETQPRQCVQSVAAPAKKLDQIRFARPLADSQTAQSFRKFPDFLFRRFETQIRLFPRIDSLHWRVLR